jgi:hypothetical protein
MLLFGWRIAFLLGAFTGAVGVMLRPRIPDPTVFLQRKHAIEEQLGVTDSQAPDDRWVEGSCYVSYLAVCYVSRLVL